MFPRVNIEERALEGPVLNASDLIDRFAALFGRGDADSILSTLQNWWNIYSIIAIVLSLLFFLGFIYAKIRYGELCAIEQQQLREEEEKWVSAGPGAVTENSRWAEIVRHSTEDDPNAWRVAIIEADILLEETLTNAGYVGATLADKLKTANHTSFSTVQDAWEAHKIRNEIAHAGSDFVLTKKVAQETIMRFERVFREFNVI